MRHTQRRRRLTVVFLTVAIFMLQSQAAFAWTVPGTGNANSFAALLAAETAPSASVSSGTATVSWAAVTFPSSSTAATGYTVNRVWRGEGQGPGGQSNGNKEGAGGSCAGTITDLSCTTSHGVGETWSYTITPLYAGWVGAESPESAPVTAVEVVAPTVTAVTLINNGTAGVAQSGDGFSITYSDVLDAQSICADFTTSTTDVQTATGMTFLFADQPNVISISANGLCGTSGLGTLQVGGSTGNSRYTQGSTLAFTASTLTWDPTTRTITVQFGTTIDSARTGVAAAEAVYTPGALTGGGLAISTTTFSSPSQRF